MDLGKQPLANGFLNKKDKLKKEYFYKLRVGFSKKSKMVQLFEVPKKEKMFNKDYPYKSSESITMKKSFRDFAKKITNRFKPKFVIEIGSNDGAFIKNFSRKNVFFKSNS